MKPKTFVYSDGGRSAAGYVGEVGDCVCRSIAIATKLPYQQVYNDLNALGKLERKDRKKKPMQSSSRTGVWRKTYQPYLQFLGWIWTPTMHIGSGCKVHLIANELPMGRLVVRLSQHFTAVIDGVIHDIHNPQLYGQRCVYGYFSPQQDK